MPINAAQTRQTDPTLVAIDYVVELASLIPVPGIQKIIKPLNALIKLFKPSPVKKIEKELNEINQKLDSVYGLVQQALTEDDIKSLMRTNNSLFIQIQNVQLALNPPDWTSIMETYSQMVENYTTAAQHTNDFLKHYEKVNVNASGYLIHYIGVFAQTMCQFYSMYALLQHTTNILREKNRLDNSSTKEQVTELLNKEQDIIINFVTQFINRALGKESTVFFNFDYPSWCKNVFTQRNVNISSIDHGGRNMKYAADSQGCHICLSESYVQGTICEEFIMSFVDIQNPQGVWKLMLQSGKTAGLESTTLYGSGSATLVDYLLTDRETKFIISHDGIYITIQLIDNGEATTAHLGAEPRHGRYVLATYDSYKWKIINLD